jgi:hypothetical protein
MVRLQISTQADNAFTASGVIKGKRIRVNRIPAISRQQIVDNRKHLGNFFIDVEGSRYWNIPAETITEPTPVAGTLTPGTFEAVGFGVPVTFQVGIVKHAAKGRKHQLGITHIEIGAKHEPGSVWEVSPKVALDAISYSALLRMAIQASRCVGMAFPVGWAVDKDLKPLGVLRVGDVIPENARRLWGVRIQQRRIASVDERCEVELWDAGEVKPLDDKTVRHLTGKAPTGRKKERDSMTDPKVLKIVAKLYTEAEKDSEVMSKPIWVQEQLKIHHGIFRGESWVRAVAVNARKAGLLKTGKRKVTK